MSEDMKEDEEELNWDNTEEEEEEVEEEEEEVEEEDEEEDEEEEEGEGDNEEAEAEIEPEPEPEPEPANDNDSDYSPKTVTSKKRRGKSTDSPAVSDTDTGRKKRRRNEVPADDPVSYSDIVCEAHNLHNIDVDIPDDSIADINYKTFSKFVRPVAQEANPKATGPQITSLVGSKWREFRELYGIDESPEVERLKAGAANESGSDVDSKGGGPVSRNGNIVNNESGDDDEDYNDGNELKLKLFRSGNSTFRAGDRKTGRQSKKTARQGIVNFDDINLDEVTRNEENDGKKGKKEEPPIKKKRLGPRIKNTKDKKEKKKAKAAAAAALALAGGKRGGFGGKGGKGKKNDEPVPEPVHNSVCDVCAEGGDILLCDTCTLSWHLTCLDPPLDEVPEGMWSCPKCEAEMNGLLEEEEDDEFHGDYCKICKDGGELLCCDTCPGTYHMKCVKPALITVPEGEWVCAMCKVEPLPEKVERILFWKILTHNPTPEEVTAGAKDEPYKVRKFFVKYANSSYWKCHWIDELQLEKFHVSLYRFFSRKNDMNDPPMTEEGTLEEGEDINVDENEHKRNLDQRFYQYGIKPEWLQVHRVIYHREVKRSKETQYLVKWKDLGYDQATWEYVNDEDNKEIQDMDKEIAKYTALRQRVKKKAKSKLKDKAGKKSGWEYDIPPNLYKHEEQPTFITDSGGRLHEYQIEGINWIRYSWGQHENTILADEMGLGKTIQTITFLNSLVKEGRCDGPFLICAPLSTLVNWEREFEFWAPDMYVVSYTGNRENRQVIRNYEISLEEDGIKKGQKAFKVKQGAAVKFHALLTSYELVSIDANTLQSIEWKAMVIDEAHRLKNNQSKFFRTMTTYTIRYTLLLTGTPLQNNLEELFHLLNFLCPHKFLSRETFLAEFEDIGKEDQIKKLHDMLGPHMLRRLKSDVLRGMPTKSEFIIRVELSPMQKKFYKYILTKNFGALNTKGSAQVSLLNIVMELKKCCNHPYLFSTAALEAPRTANNAYEVNALTEASGKLTLMYKMMKKLKAQGNRVLVFSQMTRVLDLLEDFMEGHGWRYERLDGTITGSLRQAAIDRFNTPGSDIFAFLLSTRAGGLGINLATADTVFIYDSDWNPHNDIQAFSRAHRIGQQNKVMIYRFVTKGSVEERITQVAKKKMMLTHLVVRPGLGSKAAQAMSKRELDDILKFGTDEIFKDEDTDVPEGRIVYDDSAINALLDRSKEGILEKESGMDDYLSSFKVASYTVKDKDEPDVEVLKQEADVIDSDYWEKLLRHHFEQEEEYKASTLGKGKRVRKQVNYNDGHLADTNKYRTGKFAAYDDSSDFDASELVDESEDGLSDDENKESGRAKKYKERDILPPLLAKVGNQIEVYGFNPRQRRAFLTAVMRYGLPPKDFKTAKDKWCIHNLRGKTEKAFQSYTSMFLRHLCEPGMDNKIETYSDGVPREGVNRLQVLSRIGIMSLIKRKVEEYSSVNTFLHPILQGHITIQERNMTGLLKELKNAAKPPPAAPIALTTPQPETKKEEGTKDDSVETKEEKAEPENEASGVEKMDVDKNGTTEPGVVPNEESVKEGAENGTTNGETSPVTEAETEPVEKSADKSEVVATELTNGNGEVKPTEEGTNGTVEKPKENGTNGEHAESKPDEKMAVDEKPAGETTEEAKAEGAVVTPEEGKETKAVVEAPVEEGGVQLPKFMFNIADGGFTELHVLWEAEEKRKLDNIWWRYHDYWLIAGAVVHGYGRWQDIQNDPRFDTINRPFARMSLDYKNKFIARRFKLLEQALIVEEQLKRATLMGVQQDNNHPAMSLQSRFAELECLAESHQHLSKESLSGNKPANAVLHKVLNQLETLLSDMKNDVTRLPTALAKVPPVTHRLNMSERAVLTRLAHGGQMPSTTPSTTPTAAVTAAPSTPHLSAPAAAAHPPQHIISSPPGAQPQAGPGVPVMYSTHHPPGHASSPSGNQPITNTIYLPVHPTILPSTGVPMDTKIVNI